MNETTELGKAGCWTFDPAREIWYTKTGPDTWAEIMGTLEHPPPTYQVTVDGMVVAECPSGWHATECATVLFGSRAARGKVVTIKRSDGKPV